MQMNEYYKEWLFEASICYSKRKAVVLGFCPANDIKWDMYEWVEDYANE